MIKKLIALCVVSLCISSAFAQRGRISRPVGRPTVSQTLRQKTHRQSPPNVNYYLRKKIQPRTQPPLKRCETTLLNLQDHPKLIIYTQHNGPLTARLLFPDEIDKQLHAFLPKHYIKDRYTLYRGMVLNSLEDLENILQNGLEVYRTRQGTAVWTSPSIHTALNHALPRFTLRHNGEFQTELPVMVRISRTSQLLAENPPEDLGYRQPFSRDIKPEYIAEVSVFLEVNGTPDWYTATLEDGHLVLRPQADPADLTKPNAPTNLRILPDEELFKAISNDDEMKLFVPQPFTQTENVFYRGLRLQNTEELKNILARGMEIDKTHHEMIFVSPNVSVAMEYMFPRWWGVETSEDALPVLVKIPATEQLLTENPPEIPSEDFGGRRIFYNNIPANNISDVAVYADVNGTSGWYTVTLNDGELVFTPAPAETIRGWISR